MASTERAHPTHTTHANHAGSEPHEALGADAVDAAGTPADSPSEAEAATVPAPRSGEDAEESVGAHQPGDDKREFRAEELAAEAGIPTRTLRFYRERKLLPPPRREGRIAWYNAHHLTRLRTITGLLSRGHTLGGIAELLRAFERGKDTRSAAELLGLEGALVTPFSEEVPVRLTPEQLADYYQDDVTVENLATSLDIGYIAVDGGEFVHVSRRLLEASTELVREGVPLASVLAAGRELRAHTDQVAAMFTELFREHLMPAATPDPEAQPGEDGPEAPPDPTAVAEALERVRPLAKQIVEAELGLALDRRVRAELERLWPQSEAHEEPGHTEERDLSGHDAETRPDAGPQGDPGHDEAGSNSGAHEG